MANVWWIRRGFDRCGRVRTGFHSGEDRARQEIGGCVQ